MNRSAFLFAVASLGAPTTVAAQAFDVQQLTPGSSQTTAVFGVDQAQVLGARAWELGLFLNHADAPLLLRESGDLSEIVGSQTVAELLFAVGIADRLELGVGLPLILSQTGDTIAIADVPSADDAGFGVGDVRVIPTFLFLNRDTDESPGGAALALSVPVTLPTGDDAMYQGDTGLRVEPRLAFDYALRAGTRLSLNGGYRLRDTHEVLNVTADDAVTWGAGVAIPVGAAGAVSLLGELTGEVGLGADEGGAQQTPLETTLGVRWLSAGGLMVQAGGGIGLIEGYGTPRWRGVFGLAYRHDVDCDPDDDGTGCEGTVDTCPFNAEDYDEFEDADGCPDGDNDADRIADERDACPSDPEDADGFEDRDGCPDPDNDADGIPDSADQCPDEPEDRDAFEDENGCPDPDNDADGVLDTADQCPNEPEDLDAFEDENGCPDPDNDADGMLDAADECPNEPEDFDGFEDENGCPEEGTGAVTLTCEQIEIAESVYFDTDSDRIQERSHALLDQVAAVLRGASFIRRVRVEGHTDARGSDEHNLDLSRRRAQSVMTYLTTRGIDAARIESEGYGETRPIATNDTSEGRASNRRVVFSILEQDSVCGE